MKVRRIYEPPLARDGLRVLVDRLWPRGISKEKAQLTRWCRDVAPSTELRKWYGHDPRRFAEFRRRYTRELEKGEAASALADLSDSGRRRNLTLLTATKEVEISGAEVLAEVLRARLQS